MALNDQEPIIGDEAFDGQNFDAGIKEDLRVRGHNTTSFLGFGGVRGLLYGLLEGSSIDPAALEQFGSTLKACSDGIEKAVSEIKMEWLKLLRRKRYYGLWNDNTDVTGDVMKIFLSSNAKDRFEKSNSEYSRSSLFRVKKNHYRRTSADGWVINLPSPHIVRDQHGNGTTINLYRKMEKKAVLVGELRDCEDYRNQSFYLVRAEGAYLQDDGVVNNGEEFRGTELWQNEQYSWRGERLPDEEKKRRTRELETARKDIRERFSAVLLHMFGIPTNTLREWWTRK